MEISLTLTLSPRERGFTPAPCSDYPPCPRRTDRTTSHSTDGTTSHPTKQPTGGCQVVGYKLAKIASKVADYLRRGFVAAVEQMG